MAKRLKMPEEVEIYFPGFLSFIDCTEQQIQSRPAVDEDRRKMYYSLGKMKRYTTVKNYLMVINNRGYIPHKTNNHKKGGHRHDYIFKNIKRIVLILLKRL